MLAGTRWDIVTSSSDGQWALWCATSSAAQVLTAAGVQLAGASARETKPFEYLPYEQLIQLEDADVIVLQSGSEYTSELLNEPVWESLTAAQSEQVYELAQLFPYSYGDALVMLDELEAVFGRL